MKKIVMMMSILLMTGIISSEVLAQTPNSSRNAATSRANTSTVSRPSTPSPQQSRQIRRGDSQLNKANESYQRAQQNISRPSSNSVNRPASSSSVNRQVAPSTNNSARPAASSTARPATSSTARPATSSATARPATSSATARPATSGAVSKATTTNNQSARPSANNQTVGKATEVTSSRANSNTVQETSARRGYTSEGKAQPQPVATGPRNEGSNNGNGNDDRGYGHNGHGVPHTPYVHPNHHNYNSHMHIPPRIRPVYYHGIPYYFYNSVFCRYINGYYVICRPPLGAVIAYSIFNSWRPVVIVYKNVNYYYDDGTFYLPYNNNYRVVAPPIGARVAELPSNYEEIILDNTLYYKVDNVYYKAVVVSGYIWYEVVFVS